MRDENLLKRTEAILKKLIEREIIDEEEGEEIKLTVKRTNINFDNDEKLLTFIMLTILLGRAGEKPRSLFMAELVENMGNYITEDLSIDREFLKENMERYLFECLGYDFILDHSKELTYPTLTKGKFNLSDRIEEILREKNMPLQIGLITAELVKRTWRRMRRNSISSRLSRDGRFKQYVKGVWGLKRWKYVDHYFTLSIEPYMLRSNYIRINRYMERFIRFNEFRFLLKKGNLRRERRRLHFIPERDEGYEEWSFTLNKSRKSLNTGSFFKIYRFNIGDGLLFEYSDEKLYATYIPMLYYNQLHSDELKKYVEE